jgi:DNA repair exonuclease SbcCD ATPase subunit
MNWVLEEQTVAGLSGQITFLEKSITQETAELAKVERILERTKDAQEILQLLSQAVQQKAHEKISGVVSSCLSAVFDEPYTFRVQFDRKRGKTEASLRFVRGNLDVDPLTASGGGVIDVAAFALRVACLMLHRPRLSKIVVLDEPFRFVSAQYQDNVRTMLEELAGDLGVQFVMVTHVESLAAGKIIEL